eukprot:607556_1
MTLSSHPNDPTHRRIFPSHNLYQILLSDSDHPALQNDGMTTIPPNKPLESSTYTVRDQTGIHLCTMHRHADLLEAKCAVNGRQDGSNSADIVLFKCFNPRF